MWTNSNEKLVCDVDKFGGNVKIYVAQFGQNDRRYHQVNDNDKCYQKYWLWRAVFITPGGAKFETYGDAAFAFKKNVINHAMRKIG